MRLCRGRLPARPAHVLDVRAFEGVTGGVVIAVRWDDDGSVSCLVPGADIELRAT